MTGTERKLTEYIIQLKHEITDLRLAREHYKNQLMLAQYEIATLKSDRDYMRSCLEDAYSVLATRR